MSRDPVNNYASDGAHAERRASAMHDGKNATLRSEQSDSLTVAAPREDAVEAKPAESSGPSSADYLRERGWSQWYSPHYWVHPKTVHDHSVQDYTNYGLTLGKAVEFENNQHHAYVPPPSMPAELDIHSLLREAYEAIVWMSGSSDFSPEGKAHKGWLKIRSILDKIRAVRS